ncbi:MAG: hypothetical protein H0W15_05930 [Gemmatimonadales bacterium]|nr:hypothetical protein [Gemmatimonadales bacterium]
MLVFAASLQAQQPARRTIAPADLVKDPGGTVLARIAKDATLSTAGIRGTWQEATLEGWISEPALRDDIREGFDVAVNISAGTAVRTGPGTGATIAMARAGALFKELEKRGGWVKVRRTGWVVTSALAAGQAVAPAPSPVAAGSATTPGTTAGAATTLSAGSMLSTTPRGAAVGTIESPLRVEVVERREGWTRIRIDAWTRDASLSDLAPVNQVSGADVRENPERYVGQPVEWTLQVLAVQQADELRPELPPGQPYILARGPLPETGFVYLVVRADEVERFRNLEPLARIRVRATVRSGRTRFLPTPVLNFVRRLD